MKCIDGMRRYINIHITYLLLALDMVKLKKKFLFWPNFAVNIAHNKFEKKLNFRSMLSINNALGRFYIVMLLHATYV